MMLILSNFGASSEAYMLSPSVITISVLKQKTYARMIVKTYYVFCDNVISGVTLTLHSWPNPCC